MALILHFEPVLVSILLLFSVFFSDWFVRRRRSWAKKAFPYPPGPPRRLLFGNELPQVTPWISYSDLATIYGPVLHLSSFNQHIIVLSTEDVMVDLFERRSKLYSDKPRLPMIDMSGWSFNLGLMPYSDTWRKHRRVFWQHFRPQESVTYRPTELRKVSEILRDIAANPQDIELHFRKLSASIMMSAMYGHDIESTSDKYISLVEKSVELLAKNVLPGATWVNRFPLLQHAPGWLPGMSFKVHAQKCAVLTKRMLDEPYDHVKEKLAAPHGNQAECLASKLILGASGEESVNKAVTALAYAAGGETTVSAFLSFIIAMVLHPEVVAKAHEELDCVVGNDRLPTFEDRPALPYIDAIYHEVLRWRPVLPLGVPHIVTDDDVYMGYHIPKGATVIANIWGMTRDISRFPDPSAFRPQRFLTEDGALKTDRKIYAYGFGRRICAGRYVADDTIWLTIASMLTVFNIAKAKDEFGIDIPVPEYDYTDGLVSHPKPFRYSFHLRSTHADRLVNSRDI